MKGERGRRKEKRERWPLAQRFPLTHEADAPPPASYLSYIIGGAPDGYGAPHPHPHRGRLARNLLHGRVWRSRGKATRPTNNN
eukprot:scaffold163136_cov32-Tisochrysis_lutea.AAC.1